MSLPNLIGLIGVALVLMAYGLVSTGYWKSEQPRYQWINILSSSLLICSLFYAWNLPSFILQTMWILFSVIGLWRHQRRKRQSA